MQDSGDLKRASGLLERSIGTRDFLAGQVAIDVDPAAELRAWGCGTPLEMGPDGRQQY